MALGSEVLPRVGEHVRDALPLRVRQLAPRHRILQRRIEAGPVWKSKFYGAFALNLRVDLRAPDALVDFHTARHMMLEPGRRLSPHTGVRRAHERNGAASVNSGYPVILRLIRQWGSCSPEFRRR